MKTFFAAWIVMVLLMSQAEAVTEDFADISRIESDTATRIGVTGLERRGPTGMPVIELQLDADATAAAAKVGWPVSAESVDDQTLTIQVLPIERPLERFSLGLLDEAGDVVSSHAFDDLPADRWTQLVMPVSARGMAAAFAPDPFRRGRQIRRVQIGLVGPQGQRVQVSTLESRRGPAEAAKPIADKTDLASGETRLSLDANRGWCLAGGRLAGIDCEAASGSAWPSFAVVDAAAKTATVDPASSRCSSRLVERRPDAATVEHTIDNELVVSVSYRVDPEAIHVDYAVVREGALRLAAAEQHLLVPLGTEDYGIAPTGRLLQSPDGIERSYTHDGQSDYHVVNMTAARLGERILFSKPVSRSNRLSLLVRQRQGRPVAELGGSLYFRPAGFKNLATTLAHRTLGWRFETAGDANGDGTVDWVDCGIAYREKYLRPNRHASGDLRDNYIYYHQVTTYQRLVELDAAIDFARGVWWVKNMLPTPRAADGFVYAPSSDPAHGDLAAAKARIVANGSRVGPHWSIDAIDAEAGGWPERFVKIDAEGRPARYCVTRARSGGGKAQLHYLDYGRPLADGTLLPWLDEIMKFCHQGPGDVVMLDTFLCFARPGFDPQHPSTADAETAAKRRAALHLRDTLGIHVAAEGAVEGSEDVIEYTAGGYGTRDWIRGRLWETTLPEKRVPLEQVLYTGLTFKGLDWYALRDGEPNYAAAMLLAGKLWDWSSVNANDPATLYAHCARRYFLNNVFWQQFADSRIVSFVQKESTWRVEFDNGVVVTTDPSAGRFTLQANGVTYDGFTPFGSRDVMAVFADTSAGLVLPLEDVELELLPSQPHYDILRDRITIERTPEGFVKVAGPYRDLTWKTKRLAEIDGRETVSDVEVDPLLLLRRK